MAAVLHNKADIDMISSFRKPVWFASASYLAVITRVIMCHFLLSTFSLTVLLRVYVL